MNLPGQNHPHGRDAACALALAVLTAALAMWTDGQFRQSRLPPAFYQEAFAPAVMFACGEGFHNVDWSRDEALAAFLLLKRDTLACGELGRGLPHLPLNYFQRISPYLEWAIALTWRATGVSWDAVSWLRALLAGLFGALLYGVMRLGMRPLVAAIVSLIVVTSPLHLSYVPHVRDYSKAPFLLALVLIMGILLKRASTLRHVLWLAVLGGFVAGVGFGFRTDILLAVVPFLAALFFRAGSPSLRSRLADGAMASVVFVASFALTAAPVIGRQATGGAIGHVVLLGFSDVFTKQLGVEAKHYELSSPYADWYVETAVRSYVSRLTGDTNVFSVGSTEYDRASARYLIQVIRTLPADVIVRALSAAVHVLDAPFSYTRATGWIRSAFARRLYDRRADALERARLLGWAASASVLIGITAWSARSAAFLLWLLVCFGGGAAMQFHPRHFFYLEFMPWWAAGVIVDRAAGASRSIWPFVRDGKWRSPQRIARLGAPLARAVAVLVVGLLSGTAVLSAARRYQQGNLNALFERAQALPRQPVAFATTSRGVDGVTITVDLPELELPAASWERRSIATAYLLVDLDPQRCDSTSFSARVRYEAGLNGTEFMNYVNVPLVNPPLGSSTRILIPVYAVWFPRRGHHKASFSGIDATARDASCVASISTLGDLGPFPVLITAILAPDWRTASHYQTMIGIEAREDGAPWHERWYPTLATLDIARSVISRPTTDSWPGAAVFSRVVVPAPPLGLAVDGTPETATTYLFQSRARMIPRGSCALAEGELTAGGLTFGLLRNGLWDQQVNIVERGRFLAAGCTLEDGSYSILLANNNPAAGVTTARLAKIGWVADASRETNIAISRIAWMRR